MILLTGGTGVIGRSIARKFSSDQREFVILTRDAAKAKNVLGHPAPVAEGTLADAVFLESLFKKYSFHTVIHCAWEGVSGPGRDSVDQEKNLIGTRNLLTVAGRSGIKTFVGLGSQAEYGIHNKRITEDLVPVPQTLYGKNKLAAGLEGKFIAQQFGFRYAWLRLFAAYGPDDNSAYVIPYTISSFLGQKAPDLTFCDQYWDYLFLPDIASVIDDIVHSAHHFNDIYNLSSGKAEQLKQIILRIQDLVHAKVLPNFGAIAQKSDLHFLEGSNEKLFKTFALNKLTDLDRGLSITVDWYKNHRPST